MSAPQLAEDSVQVAFFAPCEAAGLAAGTLALHLGVTRASAESLLVGGGGVVVARSRAASVRAALPVLAALGVQMALRPAHQAVEPEICDLSLHLKAGLTPAAAGIARLDLTLPLQDLKNHGPSGWLIEGLPRPRAEEMAAVLRSIPGALVTVAAQIGARYDLFAAGTVIGPAMTALRQHLAMLGCVAHGPSRALATGLDRRTLNHILGRFVHLGLVGVNQAFQRYQLVLTGSGSLTPTELRDFLTTRGACWTAACEAIASGQGWRIEGGLSRAAARQFLSDYAMIGLPARADLMGLQEYR